MNELVPTIIVMLALCYTSNDGGVYSNEFALKKWDRETESSQGTFLPFLVYNEL